MLIEIRINQLFLQNKKAKKKCLKKLTRTHTKYAQYMNSNFISYAKIN